MNTYMTDIDDYLTTLPPHKNLSPEYESKLARMVCENSDTQAEQELIASQLRFVIYAARGYSGYGLGMADLVQEGNIGLTKAVRRFDPDKGVRLISFASYSIHSAIRDYIIKNWRIVKVATTKDQRKLFFKLRSEKSEFSSFKQGEIDKLASELNVDQQSVVEMESRMMAFDKSYDATPEQAENSYDSAPAETLHVDGNDPSILLEQFSSDLQTRADLQKGLKALDQRSRDILKALWLQQNRNSLADLTDRYGVSAERIRQIERLAIKKLRIQMATA